MTEHEQNDVGSARSPLGRLPVALTSLVGRDGALGELDGLLDGTRLLSLTGPGGCGKSRLALALAGRAGAERGEACWCDLADVADQALVAERVAGALGVQPPPGGATVDAIARHLGAQRVLLVLDNCEHVVDACAALTAHLLQTCPQLSVLATTRQPLAVPGEQVWRVPGLGDDDSGPALFAERARSVAPGFVLDDATAPAVERICRWLDGMPLGIELAAARVAVLGVDEIAERLERDMSLLRQRSRTAPARHQTLAAALDWSHEMLDPGEQALLRRLAVFRGGFTLAAAEAVAAGDPLDGLDVLDALGRLVDQSLVQVVRSEGESRFRLLETIRQYAAAKLGASGEQDAVLAAHAAWFGELATRASRALRGGAEQRAWLRRLDAEHDNLRALLGRLLPGDPEAGGRLAGALWPFWYRRGHYDEARLWLEQAAGVVEEMAPDVRADVLAGAGVLAFLQCEYGVAAERLERALALRRDLGDPMGMAAVLQRLGSIAREQGRYEDARTLHEQALALWEELDDEAGVATSLDFLGFAAWLSGDLDRAEALCSRALERFRARGAAQETAACLINLGATAHYRGDDALAAARLEEALAGARELGYEEGIAWALHELGIIACRRRDPALAAARLREALVVHHRLGDRWRATSVLEEIAGGLLAQARPHRAAETLGAAGALRERLGTPVPPAERKALERALRAVRGALKPGAFRTAWAEGGTLGLDRAMDRALEALDELYSGAPAPAAPAAGPPLTDRERDVLVLLCQGATNREIGAALFISASTAGVHVSNILHKLGASGRVEAVRAALRLGLVSGDAVNGTPADLKSGAEL